MSPEEAEKAFDLINKYLENNQTGFDNTDKQIFITLCCYPRKTWTELSKELGYSEEHIRDKAVGIYRKVESVLGDDKKVNKSNFLTHVERFMNLSKVNETSIDSKNVNFIKSEISFLQEMPNPFTPINQPIHESKYFFGRDKEVQEIFKFINSGSSVAVIADPGMGKSSLLMAVAREAQNQLITQRYPIYINLDDVNNEQEIIDHICEELDIEYPGSMRNFKKLLVNNQCLLLMDQVEKLEPPDFSLSFIQQIVAWSQRDMKNDAPFKLVWTACKSLEVIFPEDKMTSPIASRFANLSIERWDKKIISDFIKHRLSLSANRQISFSENEIAQILNESGGHPQKLMTLCYEIFNKYIER
jgi:hypothetical protein